MLRQKSAGSSAGGEPMVLVYDTSLGTTTIQASFDNATVVNVVVNWGDGSSTAYTTSGRKTHTYATGGVYTVTITGTLDAFGGVGAFFTLNRELIRCLSFGNLGLTSLEQGFSGCNNLIEVPTEVPSTVTSMENMFQYCDIFNQNIGGWDVSNVTNMTGMFQQASAFNQNIGGWDVSSVTEMAFMFEDATAFNQNIGGWDVSNLRGMDFMFRNATAFNQDIGDWKTGNVRQMSNVFDGAAAFNQDLTNWCVGNFGSQAFVEGPAMNPAYLPVWGTCPSYVSAGSITYIGQANGTTSATLPAHQAGDYILAFAFRDGSTTQATLPTGWTSISTRTGTSCAARIAYQIATSGGTTSGTWTNASTVIFLVYRGVSQPTGSMSSSGAGVSTTVNYPAQGNWRDLSRLVAFAGHRSTDTALGTPPGSLTLIVNPVDATDEAAAFQSLVDNFGNWTSTNVSVGGTSSGFITFVVRLRVPITPI